MSGSQGEPGRPGAEGRAGTEGRAGSEGRAGAQGEVGIPGVPGAEGAPGLDAPGADRKILILFLILVIAFLFLAWRTETNAARIEQLRYEERLTSCEGGVAILKQFNKFVTDMAAVEAAGIASGEDPAVTPTREARIRIYNAAKVRVGDCDVMVPKP